MKSLPLIQEDIQLLPYNTFRVKARARFFTILSSQENIENFLLQWKNTPKIILGGGSNVLFTTDVDGLVIKNEIKGIECIKENDAHIWLKVGAGENWHEFVMYCIHQGYGGIENLALIPGTVGAAPMQNIGAYGLELKDVFDSLEAIDINTGTLKVFNHEECQFGYRDSIFKTICKNQFIITHVTLRLNKNPAFNVSYGALQDTLKEMHIENLSLKAVSDAVIHIRQSKLPDPNQIGNAGSFFKNPILPSKQFSILQKQFSQIPHYATESSDFVKTSAGWLIEQCGWKGKRQDDIGVHDKQALVIVNYGAGTGDAILKLAHEIQDSVYTRFEIHLTPEVNIIS